MKLLKIATTSTPIALCLALLSGVASAGWPGDLMPKCSPDSVKTGSVCMDIYEASVWQIAPTNLAGKSNAGLIKKIKKGKATAADLAAGNATQRGASTNDYPCPDTGQGCNDLYAVSLAGVLPSGSITWFQAQQVCGNSNKRLPNNAEWQVAVSASPDPGPDNGSTDCNTNSVLTSVNTGSRSSCKSRWGTFDMVGNMYEWVAEWVPLSTACPGWGAFSSTGDDQCFAGADTSTTGGPGALLRGGSFLYGDVAGPLAVVGNVQPSFSSVNVGFRCAR